MKGHSEVFNLVFEEKGIAFEPSEFNSCDFFMIIKFEKSDLDGTLSWVFKVSVL